jgi:hypothetical protein
MEFDGEFEFLKKGVHVFSFKEITYFTVMSLFFDKNILL